MDYLVYLETAWHYLPYLVCAYATLTLLPKSLIRMKRFADADYEAKRHAYHRCYGPELCCHLLGADEDILNGTTETKHNVKQRKAVTRVYPKRKTSAPCTETHADTLSPNAIKRQVNVAHIQTRTNVNQMARMFETGVNTSSSSLSPPSRRVNRVQPILPEIRMFIHADDSQNSASTPVQSRKSSLSTQLSQFLSQENIENATNLLNQLDDNYKQASSDWHSEPITIEKNTRQKRTVPSTLNFIGGGSSATPSTASPAASSSPLSSSPEPEPTSPVLLRHAALPLNMKTSMEDIYQAIARSAEQPMPVAEQQQLLFAGCKSLAPVTSIDDILSERRLSRPLSAYSITDLLSSEETAANIEETFVDSILHALDQS